MNKRKKKRLAAKRENRLAKERIRLQPLIQELERIKNLPDSLVTSTVQLISGMSRADIYKKGVADFVRNYPELDSFIRLRPDE